MKDIEKLVDLAESLIPKVTTYGRSVGMNVTDKFTTIPTDKELLQVSDSVNEMFRKKHPDYEAKYWEDYRMRMDDTFDNAIVDLGRALKEMWKALKEMWGK